MKKPWNKWNELHFDATIDSFPNETLVYSDTDVQKNVKDAEIFKVKPLFNYVFCKDVFI